ncbi:hypothetical protein [Nitrosovibrio sp. Nv4]|uniref:hypothetical protein n=1 Tax=Nitrosovibrio sp. Nv4 TaxID=1945880 RepID=UPI00135A9B05|nr:hypothetical protein [Nitrosovibrio sp. Nv4]
MLLAEGTERDLEAIHDYIAELDSATSADYVLDQLLETAETGYFPRMWSHSQGISGAS